MEPRVIAIGDIHGCAAALEAILDVVRPTAADTLVILGDYIDRGPHSRQVVERLIHWGERSKMLVLLGNHEEMLLLAQRDALELNAWLQYGGAETLASYGVDHPRLLPREHLDFIAQGLDFWEAERHFFVHANYLPEVGLDRQPPEVLRWQSLWERIPLAHASGKTAIVGHTAQREGEVWDLGHLKCIDTYCHGGGWLTAVDVGSGQLWQADRDGRLRAQALEQPAES